MEQHNFLSPAESLQQFVIDNNLQEVMMVWPTGTGKTNAAAALMHTQFRRKRVQYVIALVLKTALKDNINREMKRFFTKDAFRVLTFNEFFHEYENNSQSLMLNLNSKRVGFFVDEIDQLIPRMEINVERENKRQRLNFLEKSPNHWKQQYFSKLATIWKESLTRFLLFATATPFVNNLDRELEKYHELMFRDWCLPNSYTPRYSTGELEQEVDARVMTEVTSRIHLLPIELVQSYFPCTVHYQVNRDFDCNLDVDAQYRPYLVEPSNKILQDVHKTTDLSLLFPEDPEDNPKLANIIRQLEENKTERAFVMCYLKETQSRVINALKRRNISVLSANSDMNMEQLQSTLRRFAANSSYRVLVATEFLNSGISIPEVVQVHIVEPFVMAEPTTTIQSAGRCVRLNSHRQVGTKVRIWLYVLYHPQIMREVQRYARAMEKLNKFRKFFRKLEQVHKSFNERYPIMRRIPKLQTPKMSSDRTAVEILGERGIQLGHSKCLLYSTKDIDCRQSVMYQLCKLKPKGYVHNIFGALIRTENDLFDLSACSYVQELRPEETTTRRIKIFLESILKNDPNEDDRAPWIFITGHNRLNLRRHIIEYTDRQNVLKGEALKQSIIKGAQFINQDLIKMTQDIGIQLPEDIMSYKKKQREEIASEIIYRESIQRGWHISLFEES